jgi:L-alanine-DL-glutamate epimerase-like enolase superfamily enzyme
MRFTLLDTRLHVLPMRTRFPFKYGIASLTALPHLMLQVRLEVGGHEVTGLASEGLAPKWFTKNPATSIEEDVAEMLAVIQNGLRIGVNAARQPIGFFAWWQALREEQASWGHVRALPPLLTGLGVSLVERAVLDALCRAVGQPLHRLLHTEALGIDLGVLRPELAGLSLSQVLPAAPLPQVAIRHTVGLADPLAASGSPHLNDGLPDTLEGSIRAYDLRFFKIKLSGHLGTDLPRLAEIAAVLAAACPCGYKATLDGNEQFTDLAAFREFYRELSAHPALRQLFDSLLFIEQPLHRDHALGDEVAAVLAGWQDGPGILIDESDGSLSDLPRALELGYCGTSHKSCKGIVKGLANAALLHARRSKLSRPPLLSGEDLANVGPICQLQDLAMMALLGIPHVERNGHHYFRGLGMWPEEVQADVLRCHAGLYHRHEAGFAALDVRQGILDLSTVNAAPFGCAMPFEVQPFETLKSWLMAGGLAAL